MSACIQRLRDIASDQGKLLQALEVGLVECEKQLAADRQTIQLCEEATEKRVQQTPVARVVVCLRKHLGRCF